MARGLACRTRVAHLPARRERETEREREREREREFFIDNLLVERGEREIPGYEPS